jgi:hypothetical protein
MAQTGGSVFSPRGDTLEPEEIRCIRRLKEELGVNPAGVEVILHMRGRLNTLAERIRELEIELETYSKRRSFRLRRYQEFTYEASWFEFYEEE